MTTDDTRPQARAVRKRAGILQAATELLLAEGMPGVTHRSVAEAAEVSLGAIRYYYRTREALLIACIDDLERERDAEAAAVIRAALAGGPAEVGDTAALLLRAYYGPRLDDDTLTGTVGWVLDCTRESDALSQRVAQLRKSMDTQLRVLLDTRGHPDISTSLVSAVIDGSILTSSAEGRSSIAAVAIEVVREVLTMADHATPAQRPRARGG